MLPVFASGAELEAEQLKRLNGRWRILTGTRLTIARNAKRRTSRRTILNRRQIEELIVSEPGFSPHYRIDVRREGTMDSLMVTCEASAKGNGVGARETLALRMKSRYGLTAEIFVAEAGSLPRSEGKASAYSITRNSYFQFSSVSTNFASHALVWNASITRWSMVSVT